MNELIAYCGLDCEKCDARIATINNDNALKEQVAKLWSKLNGVEITPEMINCEGCRVEGVKTPFCNSLCPIRPCAVNKNYETCGDCSSMECCELVSGIHKNNPETKKRISQGENEDEC